jgi:DNA-binding NarL/FixJ family response regulator
MMAQEIPLTPIQKTILQLIVINGFTQDQVALEIRRSRDNVKKHCIQIRKKLGVTSLYQAVAVAIEKGWIAAPVPRK